MTPESESRTGWSKFFVPVLVPVVVAILVSVFTPVGEALQRLLFPTSSTVRGSVILQGKPIAGAGVSLDGTKRSSTDANGSFALSTVKEGDHVLTIEALGARLHRLPFHVKRNSGDADLGAIELPPSIRIAGEGSGGVDPPSDPRARRFTIVYDVAVWLEGDDDVLRRVTKVTYTFPARLQPNPVAVSSPTNRFCHRLVGSIEVRIGESVEAPVSAIVTFNDGKTLELSAPGTERLPAGRRPAACA